MTSFYIISVYLTLKVCILQELHNYSCMDTDFCMFVLVYSRLFIYIIEPDKSQTFIIHIDLIAIYNDKHACMLNKHACMLNKILYSLIAWLRIKISPLRFFSNQIIITVKIFLPDYFPNLLLFI